MDYCSVPGHPAMEQENRRLRAEVERLESYAKDRDNDARGMTRLCEQYREERDASFLQIDAMRELLSQYQSNVHLFKHGANGAPMDCKIEPCPKTTKLILTEKRVEGS
jgi:hypothetical protein